MSTTEAAHLAATTSTQICRKCDSFINASRSLAQIIPRTKRQGLAVLETNMLGSLSGRLDKYFDIVKLYCLWYAVKATVGGGLSDQLLHSKN